MSGLPRELRDLIESGPMAHLSTINADGSPQVSVIWIGLDGDVSSVATWGGTRSCATSSETRGSCCPSMRRGCPALLNPYAVLRARAAVQPSDDAWNLLNRLAKVYMSPDAEFPAPKGPGYVVRYSVKRIGGIGPWAPAAR